MDMLVLIIGFACFGGLLAGYSVARLCPVWMLWALWGLAVICCAGAFALSSTGVGTGYGDILAVYSVLLPFTFCTFVAGMAGLVARRTLGSDL